MSRGLHGASQVPPAIEGRADEYRITPARLVEGTGLATMSVGRAAPCPHPLAFLDGIQRYEVIAYAGASPLVGARVAAGVRLRTGRDLTTVLAEEHFLLIGRPSVLAAAGDLGPEVETIALLEDAPRHPLADLEAARQAIDAFRSRVERKLGDAFLQTSDAWLIVDGSLADNRRWTDRGRVLGVTKSHATLPFDGDELVTYLHLPEGHRSSIFEPDARQQAPVYSWALRLWDWEGRDVLHGLVRVEAAPGQETLERASEFSRWILAERAPISRPDPRWDRVLYGVHGVERYLRAR